MDVVIKQYRTYLLERMKDLTAASKQTGDEVFEIQLREAGLCLYRLNQAIGKYEESEPPAGGIDREV